MNFQPVFTPGCEDMIAYSIDRFHIASPFSRRTAVGRIAQRVERFHQHDTLNIGWYWLYDERSICFYDQVELSLAIAALGPNWNQRIN